MSAELSPRPAETVAGPELVAVPAIAAAEVDGLASATAWRLLTRSRQASRETAVHAVTAVGPADQRRLVVLVTLDTGRRRELEGAAAFAVIASGSARGVELELESLTRDGSLTLLVGRPVEATPRGTDPVSVPTRSGPTTVAAVQGEEGEAALLVVVGNLAATAEPIVYLHRGCVLGDALGSRDCPRGRRLDAALTAMRERGGGALVYLRDETSLGGCCVPAPAPPHVASAILRARLRGALDGLGLGPVELLATAPDRRRLGGLGLRVARSGEPA